MVRRSFTFPHRMLLLLIVCLIFAIRVDAKKKPPIRPVNLNSASAAELEQVPGIGPSTAAKILQMRKSYGAFKSVDDLLAVRGIGRKRLDKMRKYLTVGKAKVAKPAVTVNATGPPVAKSNAAPKSKATPEVKANTPQTSQVPPTANQK